MPIGSEPRELNFDAGLAALEKFQPGVSVAPFNEQPDNEAEKQENEDATHKAPLGLDGLASMRIKPHASRAGSHFIGRLNHLPSFGRN